MAKKKITTIKLLSGCLIPLILLYLLLNFIVTISYVPTGCMQGTINEKDIILTNKLAYKKRDVQRLDIVMVNAKTDLYIKRVIGMPGDKIEFVDGQVYINGELFEENYVPDGVTTICDKTFTVPSDCYFLMGDNREHSWDSREWENPYVPKKDILGRVFFNIGFQPKFHILFH